MNRRKKIVYPSVLFTRGTLVDFSLETGFERTTREKHEHFQQGNFIFFIFIYIYIFIYTSYFQMR